MRRLMIPQTYEPSSSDEAVKPRVVAVKPAGSVDTALHSLIENDPACARGLAILYHIQRELVEVLRQFVDELDGLAYQHSIHGVVPLASEPLWHTLPWIPDEPSLDEPDLDSLAEWLAWLGDEAQHWWGGLTVVTNHGVWHVGDQRPVRAILAGAAECRITRRPYAVEVINLILGRLPAARADALRQAIASVRTVRELEAPIFAAEAQAMLQHLVAQNQREVLLRPRLEPPPASARPPLPIAITHILHPGTPANPNRIAGEIETRNVNVRDLTLLEPIAHAELALDECLPPSGCARRLLDQLAETAPELRLLALQIADQLDGLAFARNTGNIPLAGIILHRAIGDLIRYPRSDPWDRAVIFYNGLRLSIGYSVMGLVIETPIGVWSTRLAYPLRVVLARQTSCRIIQLKRVLDSGHFCMELPISDTLRIRWKSRA